MTFCEATTPTLARVCAQRDATAGLDEQIDDAECARGLVSCNERERHRPVSLLGSLMTAVASISTSHSGRASASTTRPGRHRVDALEPAAHDPVHRFAVADVGEVDGDLDDVAQRAACLVEQHRDVAHRLLGLSLDVADADRFPGVEILADLTAQVDHAAGDDGLAEVVVEVLLGVGVLGVERPDPLVGCPCASRLRVDHDWRSFLTWS